MNYLPLIIKREYLTKIKNKSFIVMTFLSPVLMIFLALAVAYLTQKNNDKTRVISVLDESGLLYDAFKSSSKLKYQKLHNVSLEEARQLVEEASSYGLLHITKTNNLNRLSNHIKFYSKEAASLSLITKVEGLLARKITQLKLQNYGVSLDKIKTSKTKVNIIQESFKGKKTSKIDGFIKLAFGGAAGYLLFMFIIIYGNMIMRSVIEEKTNRVIEVIISSVKPVQLMLGKIIGTSLAGVTQFIVWIIFGGAILIGLSVFLDVDLVNQSPIQQDIALQALENQNLKIQIQEVVTSFFKMPILNLIVAFVLFFILGYLLYSSIYAAIGAAVDSETDTQQFLLPVMMPLILSVYIGFFTVIENPHGTISTVFSFIPFTSPVVMLMRIPFGVPVWQQVVALLILLVSFGIMVWFASKIYRVGILMYGKKPSYKDLVKWIKY